jgi:hypothetical protein
MAYSVLSSEKKCATCAYWTGQRRINFISNKPHSLNVDVGKFTCLAQAKKETQGIETCPKWHIWASL